jgi:hypothetical protein
MKVALPNNNGKKKELPPLPLEPNEDVEANEMKLAKFKLRTDPSKTDSTVYSFTLVKLDGSETLRMGLDFYVKSQKVMVGLDITDIDKQLTMYRELMTGQALQQFNKGVDEYSKVMWAKEREDERKRQVAANASAADTTAAVNAVPKPAPTQATIAAGLGSLIRHMAPHKALAKQKRWLRRFCRKPADMPIRVFTNHVTRINDDELPILPPFGGSSQKLSGDEVIDIVLNGIPRSWMREMDKQGFDPVEHTLTDVIHFCERMEATEDFDPARDGGKTKSKDGKVPRKDSSAKKSKSEGGKYCLLHGNNGSHNTDDCMVLKNQAKALRNNDGDRKPAYKNKTWKRDADKSTNSSKKELAAFVRKQARKELYAFAKKRKASEDDDDKSVNAMEQGEIDFSEFNFGNMDNLKIDSDDSDDDSKNGDEVSV